MSSPLNKWEASVVDGRLGELAVIHAFLANMGITLVDNAQEQHKNPDLAGKLLAEIKILKSPYPSSPTPSNLMRENHLTLDVSNVDDYPPETMIIMAVDYTEAGLHTKGLYYILAGMVQQLMDKQPKRIYSRSYRGDKDKTLKVGVSTRECGVITFPGRTMSQTVDLVLDRQELFREVPCA